MVFKDTFFSDKQSLNCRGQLIALNSPLIMGILNITPDSFYAGSRITEPGKILEVAAEMIDQGADLLDIGASSSRPGAREIPVKEEMKRLETALKVVRKEFPNLLLSVDTYRSEIARRVVEDFGVNMINDISGGGMDREMFPVVADLQVPYILMHMRGRPENMQKHTVYNDVVREVIRDLSGKVGRLNRMGVNDIIIDPGFGFAKNVEQNFKLLNRLEAFRIFLQPLMVGLSRKSMIYRTLDTGPEDALNGSTVLHTIALMKGADILRVHDVREAREAVMLVQKMQGD